MRGTCCALGASLVPWDCALQTYRNHLAVNYAFFCQNLVIRTGIGKFIGARKSEENIWPKPIFGCGIVPLNRRLTLESKPLTRLQEDLPILQNCWCWWRSKLLVLFFTIFGLDNGVIFPMVKSTHSRLLSAIQIKCDRKRCGHVGIFPVTISSRV